MNRILKYRLSRRPQQVLDLQAGSTALCVQVQNGEGVLYASEPDNASRSSVTITSVLTGELVPCDAGAYVGTLMLDGGRFVQHVYASYPPVEVPHV